MGSNTVTKILNNPELFLGGDMAAASSQFFVKKNIRAVLNCTPEIRHYFPERAEYARVSLGDSRESDDLSRMREMLEFAAEWIHIHRDIYKLNVLVHCNQGVNRSASCLAAYLIKYRKMTLRQVKDMYTQTRQAAFYHGSYATFENELQEFEKKYIK
jgi:protein-tyrosine phosphatase